MQGMIQKREGKRGTTYQVIISYTDQNGKARQLWKTAKSKKEAEVLRNELLVQVQNGFDIDPEKLTVEEFLKKWLADRKGKVSQGTHYNYTLITKQHIIPELGALPLSKLRPIDLRDFEAKLSKEGRKDNKKTAGPGLAASYVHKIHVVIRGALHDALKWELVYRNVADAVDPPKAVRKEVIPLTEKEINVLLDGLKGTYLYVPTFIALATGLRLGEVLGLLWRDVDLEQGVLTVREAQKTKREGVGDAITYETVYGCPKSEASKRSLDIPEALIEVLKRHRLEQKKNRLACGEVYQDHDLICCREDGSPFKNETMGSRFSALAHKMGMDISFHVLRHTHASQLVRLNESLKIISARLGHSGIGITADTYGHLYPDAQKSAATKINTLFAGQK